MIKRLQKKFVIISMISVIAVLTVIMTLINVMNYKKIADDVDVILEMLSENNGKFPKPDMLPDGTGDNNRFDEGADKKLDFKDRKMSAETPYETRYFSALTGSDGVIKWTNTGNIAAVDDKTAQNYILKAVNSKKTKGYIECYRYLVSEEDGESLIIFVDCSKQLSTAGTFLKASILISIIGSAAVFVLLVCLSRIVMKPIAESYSKQKRFITDSSHEIKTPLAVISANTEVIELMNGESEWTESIRKQVDRLTSLTKNLTALARMDEDGIKVERAQFNMSDAVVDVVTGFKVLAEQRNITMTVEIEDGLLYNGEEKSIRQLVNILMDNAVKYSNGIIKVSLKKSKNRIKFSVYNTASNIDTGSLNHYFDRFYRADASRSKDIEGFGIGLSIAKSIVELHGGSISAVSEDGASITITAAF